MFLFQVFVNSAMTMGIAPITGIPLPFVSVGGSSMITNFLAIGILQAIYMRRVATEARVKAKQPLAALSVFREIRRGAGDQRPLAVAGARELVPLLARELREGGDAVGGRRGARRGRCRSRLGRRRPTRTRCARPRAPASRSSRSPTSASVPYVLAEDLVRVPPGQGFPVDAIARAVARRLGENGTALAARCRCCGRRSATS